MCLAVWSRLPVARSFKHLWVSSLPRATFSIWHPFLVNGLQSPSWISSGPETCGHISHAFEIQMLWSKLSSELRLNHPSFFINRRTQLPAQLLRYFELQRRLSKDISSFHFFMQGEKKILKEIVYWFHVSYPTTKEVHFWSSWGKKVLHGDISSD